MPTNNPSAIAPYNSAPLRNREVTSSTWATSIVEQLQVAPNTALDFSSLRLTAVPAGSNGRIRINSNDSTKLAETNTPTTAIRMQIATWAPDISEVPLPMNKDEITAGIANLAAAGFNAIRIHGIEYWIMAGTNSELEFPSDRLYYFDWFLSECKRLGLYWIINPRQPELYQAGPSRFSMPGSAKNYKQRIFVQQDARDNWRAGFNLLYNRVNQFTGINILQDPALFLIECFNECGAAFVASAAWPAVWRTRDFAQGTGAQTWLEWLSTKYSGNISSLNASWGTGYVLFTDIPDPSGTELPTNTIVGTQRTIDVGLYIAYLDSALATYFQGEMSYFGYTGLYVSIIAFPYAQFLRQSAGDTGNSVNNLHHYTFLAPFPTNGAVLTGVTSNGPIWDFESWVYTPSMYTGSKPSYMGEYGWPYWGQYRNQYPMLYAFAAFGGVSGVSLFHQGNFFTPTYKSTSPSRVATLFPYSGSGDPVVLYTQAAAFFAFHKGYITEGTLGKTLIMNDNYYGFSTRNTGRLARAFSNFFLPTQSYGGLVKTQTTYTTNLTDDSLATTEANKSWATVCSDMLTATAITADNLSYISSVANNGTITAVATTGVVGTVTASLTQPVLTLSGANTLVDGDQIAILNMTGTPGTWPGTSKLGTRAYIKQTGVANRVQITSGLDLTAGLSGANFTAGTWSEFANVMQNSTKELTISRRNKYVVADTTKFKFVAVTTGFTLPTISSVSSISMSDSSSFFIASLDNNVITSSTRLLIGVCGNAQNTGDVYSGDRVTLTTAGTYPIQYQDNTLSFTLSVSNVLKFKLYRLQKNGLRSSEETPIEKDIDAGTLSVTLKTGQIYPTVFFELIQQ